MSKVPPDVAKGQPHVYDEVICGGHDGTPRLYKIHRETKRRIGDDDNKLKSYSPMPGRIYSLSFNTDGSKFVAGSSKDGTGEARIYNTEDAKFVPCQGQKGAVYAVAFRPDGAQVASAGFDGLVRLNDAATGQLVREFLPFPKNNAAGRDISSDRRADSLQDWPFDLRGAPHDPAARPFARPGRGH